MIHVNARASKREREFKERGYDPRAFRLFFSLFLFVFFFFEICFKITLTRLSSSLKKEEEEEEEEFVRPSRREKRKKKRESALDINATTFFFLSLSLSSFAVFKSKYARARVKIWIDQISPPSARAYFN